MNIRELKLFRHLSDTLHFGRTSRACNITPSALTRMVQRIENDLEAPLFTRDNRSVKLTRAGEAFRSFAEDVILRWAQLQNDIASDGTLKGTLSLYGSVTAVYTILPGILKKFRKMYPEVQINLETGDAAKALVKLQNGEADLTIAALPGKNLPGIEVVKIIETPLVFIAPLQSPDTVKYSGNEIDWQNTPLIIADHGLSRERFYRWLTSHNVSPNIYAQVAGNEAIIAMVSLGCGVGVIPRLVLEKSPLRDEVTVLNAYPELTPFSIGVCTMKKNMSNPRIDAFWSIATDKI